MALVYWAVAVMAVVTQATSTGASPYGRVQQQQPATNYRQLPALLDKRVHDGMEYSTVQEAVSFYRT